MDDMQKKEREVLFNNAFNDVFKSLIELCYINKMTCKADTEKEVSDSQAACVSLSQILARLMLSYSTPDTGSLHDLLDFHLESIKSMSHEFLKCSKIPTKSQKH